MSCRTGRNLFLETGTVFLVPQILHPEFWEACRQLASIYWTGVKCPAIDTYLSFCYLPGLPYGRACCSSPCCGSHRRYWEEELSRAQKVPREPSLTKAIIRCYWKSYAVLGFFTLLEVKAFIAANCFSGPLGREARSLSG